MTLVPLHLAPSRYPSEPVPDLLTSQPEEIRRFLCSSLANDEASTDEELIAHWIDDGQVPKEVAHAAIAYRPQFFLNPFFQLFPGM